MLELVAIRYTGAHGAERALADMRASRSDVWLSEVGLIERDTDGRLSVKAKSPHPEPDRAAAGDAQGALTGVFLGLVGGSLGFALAAVLGAISGGVLGVHHARAFRPLISELEDALAPDGSMLVLIANDEIAAELVRASGAASADVLHERLTHEQIGDLEHHHRGVRAASGGWSEEGRDGEEPPPPGPAQTYGA